MRRHSPVWEMYCSQVGEMLKEREEVENTLNCGDKISSPGPTKDFIRPVKQRRWIFTAKGPFRCIGLALGSHRALTHTALVVFSQLVARAAGTVESARGSDTLVLAVVSPLCTQVLS